jgi:predicted ArsR family transcriptional regulator
MDLKWPQPILFENCRHEQLPSPRSRIQMTVTKMSGAQQEVLATQLDITVTQSLLQLEEPDIRHVKKRGRPAGRGKVSKRDKSLFEHV